MADRPATAELHTWAYGPKDGSMTMGDGVDGRPYISYPNATVDTSGGPVNTSVRSRGADLIAAERRRQIEAEGWSIEHDREHGSALLIRAGHAYATGNGGWWPFDNGASFKPKGSLRNLVRAGALYQAAADVAAGGDQHRERCEGYRDDCARRIDVLIAEVLAVLDGE